ncbi:thioredoxin domain-containing protein [Flavobacterium sp. ANB]|uniref:thioredoxin domain-containing protein n=1 Tax=unclassified Flavobacterium TaxID=196869 RepID=UPI0012B7248F|nr:MULTISPECIES: thioredoxin domain-containing protein [unclassified Flavobacterium]MBF4518767.1 thioredoxin domain-containing protein [Flavobacterium sp. ANB]MTD71520.1 thioredoxin domain-containing protein [Flavobacterium sp. LC2016-13]
MSENFTNLFLYLKKENINIDKNEFIFQVQSHPDYPSLLSIADTLSFFNVKNGAINVSFSEIELLPNHFIAILKEENDKPTIETKQYFIERRNNAYFYVKDKRSISISNNSLELRWFGIILLLEKPEEEEILIKSKNRFFWVLPFLCLMSFLAVLFQMEDYFKSKIFFLFPIVGMFFSITALKDLFGTKIEFLNRFCNITNSTSCSTVVSSNKWKIFEIVNFSDLSLVFFSSQFLGLLFFFLLGDTITYFLIQKIILIVSVPILFLSLYYQKFVENKWCPICLAIIALILTEILYLMAFKYSVYQISNKKIIVFSFVFLSVMFIWSALKKMFIQRKELKEHQLKAIRFERNYTIFKNSLLAKDKVELPESLIVLGNKESKTIITIISNPFCSFCKDAHEIMENILDRYHKEIQIQVILKTNIEKENEEGKKLFRSLMGIYKFDGEANFTKALKNWFENKKIIEWFRLFTVIESNEFDSMFNNQQQWCEDNDYNFTPLIFINGYEYPQMYEEKNLLFFINDLIEDEF